MHALSMVGHHSRHLHDAGVLTSRPFEGNGSARPNYGMEKFYLAHASGLVTDSVLSDD